MLCLRKFSITLLLPCLFVVSASSAYAEDMIIQIKGESSPSADIELVVEGEKVDVSKAGFAYSQVSPGDVSIELKSASGASFGIFPIHIPAEKNVEVILRLRDSIVDIEVEFYPPDFGEIKTGYLVGIVKSTFDDIAIEGAEIRAVGDSENVATSDVDGQFTLELPRGVASIEVSHPQHESRTINDILIFSGESSLADVTLKKIGYNKEVNEVVVFGAVTGLPTASAAIERDSKTVMDVLNSDDLARSGDSSVASAITRITGVSVVDDKFAVVRGLSGRYISSTLDGGLLPSTDFLRRDVPLDLFPSAILGGIQVDKSYRPELPGDTTGGMIAMLARGIPEEQINEFSISTGINTEVYGEELLTYTGGDRDYLGKDDGTRELPAVLDKLTDYGRRDLPNVCLPAPLALPGCVSPEEHAQLGKSLPNNYNTYYQTGDPAFAVSYAYGDRYSLNYGDIGFYGAVDYDQGWTARPDAHEISWTNQGDGDFTLSEVENYRRSARKVDISGVFVVGFEDDRGNQLTSKTFLLRKTSDVTRFSARQDLTEDKLFEETTLHWAEQQLVSQKLSGLYYMGPDENHSLDWHIGYSISSRYEPDKREYTYENGHLTPSRVFRKYTNLDETAVDLGLDYEWEVQISGNVYPTLKAGLYSVIKDRELESARYGFSVKAGIDRSQDMETIFDPANFDRDLVRLRSQGQSTDYFDASDDMAAAYLSTETDFGESLSLLLGARYEDAEQSINYPLADEGSALSPLRSTEILPAVMLTWKATDDVQFRVGGSQTISRPGLVERSNSQFYDPDTDEKIVGNPDLEISNIDNIDLRGEYYFSEEENVSLALFYKAIKAPIEKTVPAGVRDGYTFRNSNKADLMGVEVDFKKNLFDNGDWFVFLSGNAAWIDSEVELNEETARLEGIEGSPRYTRPLQGQSEYLANMQLGMDHFGTGHGLTLMFNYFGDRINRVDNVSRGDRIERARALVDMIYKYEFGERFTLKSKITNLLNESVVYESSGERQKTREEYKEGVGVSLGLSVNL